MILWLRATVVTIVMGAIATVAPPDAPNHGTNHWYVTQQTPASVRTPTTVSVRTPTTESRRAPSVHPPARPFSPPSTSAADSGRPEGPESAHGPRPGTASPSPSPSSSGRRPWDPAAVPGPHRASPSASLAPSPSATPPSRAGSRAGEGRARPGRREEPVPEEEDVAASSRTEETGDGTGDGDLAAVSEPPPRTAVTRARPAERPVAAPKVFILPLGTGLVLVGLGLGLGLFALRIRRG